MANNVTVNGFHHVAMRVKDLDAAVKFYSQVLGFPVVRAWGEGEKRGVMLDTGKGNCIELFANGPDGERPDGHWAHLALSCTNTDAAIARVRAAGCTVTMEPADIDIPSSPAYPVRIAFFKGPAGEVIEFFQER